MIKCEISALDIKMQEFPLATIIQKLPMFINNETPFLQDDIQVPNFDFYGVPQIHWKPTRPKHVFSSSWWRSKFNVVTKQDRYLFSG